MKRFFSACFALAFLSSAFAACTMDFDQFNAAGGAGGSGGAGGIGGACTAACCAPSDCPAPSDPCLTATCDAGTCGEEPIPDGTEAGTQTAGDCKKLVCMGGATTSENDDADVLDDGNECTVDACEAGTPTNNPAAPATPCTANGGAVCNGMGTCVGCLMDGDCPAEAPNCNPGNTCVSAECNDNDKNGGETDVDCGGPACPPCADGSDCKEDTDCQSGVCSGAGANEKCQAPSCSDNVENGSETDVDCGGNCADCGPNQGCMQDNDCEGNDCSGGMCVPNCDDEVKNNAETDVDCGGPTCDPCDTGDTCVVNGDCASNNCMNGTCGLIVLGGPCGVDGDCASGQCADGVCCNNNCGNTCQSCKLAGSVGTCTDIPAGEDPDNECTAPATCDGAGACKEPDGSTCSNAGECLSGFCVDGVCCNESCGGLCKSCNVPNNLGTCGNTPAGQEQGQECSGNTTCNGMGMCTM